MPFPAAPANGATHSEGGVNYIFDSAENAWIIVGSSGVTNLALGTVTGTTMDVNSDTGTNATLTGATATDAGVMTAPDKVKLDGIEPLATADQNAGEVPVTAAGNLSATDVQAALVELQGDIDLINSLGGVYTGAAATVATLPTTREDGTPVQNGDTAILSVDDGANESGWWVYDGTNWTFAKEIPETIGAATDTTAGVVELATNAEADAGTSTVHAVTPANLPTAVKAHETDTTLVSTATQVLTYTNEDTTTAASVHDVRTPTGATLPTDDTNSREFILIGNATLPDGLYAWNGTAWFQVG